ncbi:MAG: glycosyltransferase [Lachnospiraceae bacterium]|nr:glycosyltransferase [Lachnospiraceae bacterium]
MEISVLLFTYNHEKFIRKSLDSVIAQVIDVPFEILICDDASTDRTKAIIREYKINEPDKIKLYFRKFNGNHPSKYFYYLISKAKGRYFAVLEGDDYWIDSQKLQKQYEFMEANPQYSACTGDNIFIDEDGQRLYGLDLKQKSIKSSNVFTIDDYRQGMRAGHISTAFFRNYFDKEKYKILYRANNYIGDFTLEILCLIKGDIYCMDESFSAWRIVKKEGRLNFSSIDIKNRYHGYASVCYFIRIENYLRKNYDNKFSFAFTSSLMLTYCRGLPLNAYRKILLLGLDKWRYIKHSIALILLSGHYHPSSEIMKNSRPYDAAKFKKETKRLIIFGAGAMAEEYLDQEGWREWPLFIVDNSIEKQGKSFKGYLIKKPEDILVIKNKVTVLITSKFHEQEIAAQLEKMGIHDYYFYCGMRSWKSRNRLANWLLIN